MGCPAVVAKRCLRSAGRGEKGAASGRTCDEAVAGGGPQDGRVPSANGRGRGRGRGIAAVAAVAGGRGRGRRMAAGKDKVGLAAGKYKVGPEAPEGEGGSDGQVDVSGDGSSSSSSDGSSSSVSGDEEESGSSEEVEVEGGSSDDDVAKPSTSRGLPRMQAAGKDGWTAELCIGHFSLRTPHSHTYTQPHARTHARTYPPAIPVLPLLTQAEGQAGVQAGGEDALLLQGGVFGGARRVA